MSKLITWTSPEPIWEGIPSGALGGTVYGRHPSKSTISPQHICFLLYHVTLHISQHVFAYITIFPNRPPSSRARTMLYWSNPPPWYLEQNRCYVNIHQILEKDGGRKEEMERGRKTGWKPQIFPCPFFLSEKVNFMHQVDGIVERLHIWLNIISRLN